MTGRLRSERGQILPLLAVGMALLLLALTAFVLDVGDVMLAKRHLQASADAAALAGAGALPDPAVASATASAYVGRNPTAGVDGLTTTVATACAGADAPPDCDAQLRPNALVVTERARVPMNFARVLGIDAMSVSATATAARSGSTKPLDIVLVLDRTHSMAEQMRNLADGVQAFLDELPPADHVALVVLPPVPRGGSACTRYPNPGGPGDFYPATATYLVDHLTGDYAQIRHDVSCLAEGGSTSYEPALIAAQAELTSAYARPEADKVIVFETDGAANTVADGSYVPPVDTYQGVVTGWPAAGADDQIKHPCGSAVAYAQAVADGSTHTTVSVLHFDHSTDQTCYVAPHHYWSGGRHPWQLEVGYRSVVESGYASSSSALEAIAAATGGQYAEQNNGSLLAETFAQLAQSLSRPKLVQDAVPG